ncbi:MAG: MFS transporter [Aggregatilineales bacterium]
MTETAAQPGETFDFKRILPIFVIVLVDLLGLTIIIPVLPLYAVSFGANPSTIGLLATAYPLMQLIGGPLLGSLSDRLGRRPVLIVSQFGTFFGFLLLAAANALPLLFLSRIIDGFTGGNIVTAQAAITDSTTSRTRAQGLGLIGAAFGLGFVLGPAISGVALALSDNNYRVPALIAAVFSLTSIALTLTWFKETLPPEKRGTAKRQRSNTVQRIVSAIRRPQVGVLLVLIFLYQLVFGGFEALLTLFNLSRVGLDAAGNALVFVLVGIILVLVQGKFIGPWSRRYGERRLIYVGLALLALGLILTALTPEVPVPWYDPAKVVAELDADPSRSLSVPLPPADNTGWLGLAWLLVAMIPAAVGGALISPSINSLITRRTPPTDVGGILGVSSSLVSLANTITPLVGGTLFQLFGTTAPFLVGGVMMALLVVAALRHVRPGPEETLAPTASSAA